MECVSWTALEKTNTLCSKRRCHNISFQEEDFEGLSCRTGIVTPLRSISAMSSKFGVAYVYGQDMNRVLVMNLSKERVKVKRGAQVAEFHPRSESDLILLSTQETSCDPKGTDLSHDLNATSNEQRDVEQQVT